MVRSIDDDDLGEVIHASSLLAEEVPPGVAAKLQSERADDPAWRELFARTCQALTGQPPPVLEEIADPRRACDLDRYELRAPDTVVARQDVAVFMLYEWLLAGRVDRELAAGVARPLLMSDTLAARGIALPQGTIDLAPQGGPGIWISPLAVYVDDVAVLSLTPDAFVGHVSPTLREAFAEVHRRGLERAEQTSIPRSTTRRIRSRTGANEPRGRGSARLSGPTMWDRCGDRRGPARATAGPCTRLAGPTSSTPSRRWPNHRRTSSCDSSPRVKSTA